jgi:hypothetical protein
LPTDATSGVDLAALEQALKNKSIKACLFSSRANCRCIFAPAQPDFLATSLRDFLSGAYSRRDSSQHAQAVSQKHKCLTGQVIQVGLKSAHSFTVGSAETSRRTVLRKQKRG